MTTQTFIGTLVRDPELRFAGTEGMAVANFTIAVNDRKYNSQTQQWEDGEPMFLDATVWRGMAENVTENLTKGSRVIAVGKLKQENWEKDGQKRSKLVLNVEEVGPSLKFAAKPKTDPWA